MNNEIVITEKVFNDLMWAAATADAGDIPGPDNIAQVLSNHFMDSIECPDFDLDDLDDRGIHPWAYEQADIATKNIIMAVTSMLILHINNQLRDVA